jgi:RNA polymerase sigma-70 factor (ECF subfamily)
MDDSFDPIDDKPRPDELSDQTRARAVLDRVLVRMPEDMRVVFVLCEIEQMTAPEIARLLDLPVGTVASRLRRGRELFEARAARWSAVEFAIDRACPGNFSGSNWSYQP